MIDKNKAAEIQQDVKRTVAQVKNKLI